MTKQYGKIGRYSVKFDDLCTKYSKGLGITKMKASELIAQKIERCKKW